VFADPSQNTLDSHPRIFSILMLSDLFKLFEPLGLRESLSEATGPRQNHVALKISFYAAHILSTPSAILRDVSDEVVARSKIVEKEAVSSPSNISADSQPYAAGSLSGSWRGHLPTPQQEFEPNDKIKPVIKELP
jgi:hypothetical protein